MDTNRTMFLLAHCDEKSKKIGFRPIGDEAEVPRGYWQKHCNFFPFSLKQLVYNFKKLKIL
jgi:hypothetical protein